MIKFLCDLCGKDISEKVHDSVQQFYGRYHFKQSVQPGGTQDDSRQLPRAQRNVENERNVVLLEVKLLDELTRLIHASAWGMHTTAIQCANCAMEHPERKRGKAITIFTRIGIQRRAN